MLGAEQPVFKLLLGWLPRLVNILWNHRSTKSKELAALSDAFGDPRILASYYIEPDCQQFNPADDDEEEISYVVREPVFRRLEAFLGGPRREGKHQLLILSDAGMGKTSVLVMLKLAHLHSFWSKGYNCFLFKCDKELLRSIAALPDRSKSVLLIDALDEDSLAWGRVRERIAEILRETYHFRRVIITCRTQFFSADEDPFNRRGQVEVEGFLCPVIYNSLFNDGQVSRYLARRFSKREDGKFLIEKSGHIIGKMGSLKFRPMLLSHIEDLLEADQSVWNEYTTYEALVRAWLNREQRKELERQQRPTLNDLWKACQLLAVYLQAAGSREISAARLSELIEKNSLMAHIPAMEITGRSLLNRNSCGDYRFSHYSIQEFLLVHGALDGTIDLAANGIRPTGQMNQFLAARLTTSTSGLLLKCIEQFDLEGANLAGACLDEADLRQLNLARANLNSASLRGSQLQWAKFVDADLRGADLTSAKIHWANFRGAIFDQATKWPSGGPPEGAIVSNE